jgi:rare lipoprotein A
MTKFDGVATARGYDASAPWDDNRTGLAQLAPPSFERASNTALRSPMVSSQTAARSAPREARSLRCARENAENFLARMKLQIEWLAAALHVFSRDGLYRVHAGPYPRETEARRDAARIGQTLGLRPFVLTR